MQRYDRILPPPSNSVGGNAAEQDLTSNNNEILCSLTAHRTYAFTLVELSIVLVIIGLVAGGILVGRDLIHSAENRAYVGQLQSYNVAVNTFKTKYNCLPGDCANATDYFAGTLNGNGNGMISGLLGADSHYTYDYTFVNTDYTTIAFIQCSSSYYHEGPCAWKHLQAASLISSTMFSFSDVNTPSIISSLPAAKNDGTGILVTAFGGKHYFRSGVTGTWNGGTSTYTLNFAPVDAAYIFDKIGGGNIPTVNTIPGSGGYGLYPSDLGKNRVVVSYNQNSDYSFYRFQSQGTGGSTAPYCIDTSVTPAYFNLKNPNKLCSLIIQADF